MSKTVYFNTKTNATSEMTKKEYNGMKPEFQKRWREASDSEIALHEKRKEQSDLVNKHEKKRAKAKEKADAEREAKLNAKLGSKKEEETAPAGNDSENTEGSEESADS